MLSNGVVCWRAMASLNAFLPQAKLHIQLTYSRNPGSTVLIVPKGFTAPNLLL